MARIRFSVFAGEIPKLASHVLGDHNAQSSLNAKIDSGMLEAWYNSSVIENTTTVDPLTLYKYVQDDGATEGWFVSAEDLDFVDNPQSADTYERVFFAGAVNDDFYADYVLVGGSALDSEGTDSYDPSTYTITLTDDYGASDFAVGDYVLYSSTLYEISAVSLNVGAGSNTITLSDGPTSLSGNIGIQEKLYDSPNYGESELRFFANDLDGVETWNGHTHYEILGIEPPDDEPAGWVDTGSGSGLGEGNLELSWVYTYVNSYGEESPPSSPQAVATYNTTDKLYVNFKPPFGVGANEACMPEDFHYNIDQIILYRSATGTTTADFLESLVLNLASIENTRYSATGVDSYVPATGVITLTTDFSAGDIDSAKYHYVKDLDNGRYYRITAESLGGGAGADTITIGDAKPNTLSSTIDIVEWITEDDTATANLGDPIGSEDYYPPITGLEGLTSMASGHLYAWKNNVLYYSFPYLPHAWKPTDVISIDQQIVVARGFANTLCIATQGNPYVFSGQSPRTFNKIKMGKWVPCLSKRATVKLDNAILFPSREGLMELSANGVRNTTAKLIRREQWVSYVMNAAFALFRNDRYYAFPNNDSISGFLIDFIDMQYQTLSIPAECGYVTRDDGIMYYVSIDASEGAAGTRRSVKQWQGDTLSYLSYTWKSKRTILPNNVNIAVARVELDDDFYGNVLDLIDDNDYLEEQNATLFAEQVEHEDVGYDSYVAGTGVITLTADFAAGSITTNMRVRDKTTDKDYPIASVSLGGGAGADTITLDTVAGGGGEASPPAALNEPFDIIIPRDLQGTINGGDLIDDLAGRQVNRHTINGDILFDLNDIAASPYVNLIIYADGEEIYNKNVSSAKAFKLPKGTKGKRWEVQLSGTIPVRRFDMATTMKELISS